MGKRRLWGASWTPVTAVMLILAWTQIPGLTSALYPPQAGSAKQHLNVNRVWEGRTQAQGWETGREAPSSLIPAQPWLPSAVPREFLKSPPLFSKF